MKMVRVENSKYRDLLLEQTEPHDRLGNVYGLYLTEEGYPIICGHWGSGWLCENCVEESE